MAEKEKDLLSELREAFFEAEPAGFWRKMIGDRYSAGLPDVLVVTERRAAFVEAKWVRDEATAAAPLLSAAGKLLTPLQANTLLLLGALDAPLRARVLLGMKVEADELPGGEADLAVGFDFNDLDQLGGWSLLRIAQVWLSGKLSKGWESSPGMGRFAAQLRGRGEEWRAVPLLLGVDTWRFVE